ncbi:hypothetical protein [Streptosporangium sp. NPDC087985]|uniref:hypothetical protein n=1 Tax=Streptosporangium sp. NPDC087985 TaxID=3366196 RepID=UPI00381D5F2D
MTRVRGKARAQLELEVALEVEQERLLDAKQAHTANPTEETWAAMQAEMESLAETRTWLRAVDGIRQAEAEIARDPGSEQAKVAEFRLSQLQRDFGPLIAAMQQLASGVGGGV